MAKDSHAPIGILDSGFGGLNVLAQAMGLAPLERFIYYGDFANAPYGAKSVEEVAGFVRQAAWALVDMGAKALVLACNTATSAAVADLRGRLDIPVVGMEPALKPAAQRFPRGSILVMATPLTLREKKYRDLLERFERDCRFVELPCPGLATEIDRGDLEAAACLTRRLLDACPEIQTADADTVGADDFANAIDGNKALGVLVDAVVLGCSHYVFIADAVRQWFDRSDVSNLDAPSPRRPPIALFEGAEGTARQLMAVLKEQFLCAQGADDNTPPPSGAKRIQLVLPGATEDAPAIANALLGKARTHPC